MLIAFQVILFVVVLFSLLGVIGEKENESLRQSMTAICIAGIIALVITFLVLK